MVSSYDSIVRSRLLTPSVAVIPAPQVVAGTKGGEHRVIYAVGQFDSQNAFGAILRGYYIIQWWHAGIDPMPDDQSTHVKFIDLRDADKFDLAESFRLDVIMDDIKALKRQDPPAP